MTDQTNTHDGEGVERVALALAKIGNTLTVEQVRSGLSIHEVQARAAIVALNTSSFPPADTPLEPQGCECKETVASAEWCPKCAPLLLADYSGIVLVDPADFVVMTCPSCKMPFTDEAEFAEHMGGQCDPVADGGEDATLVEELATWSGQAVGPVCRKAINHIEAQSATIARLRGAGARLANCAFNLSQRAHLTVNERLSLDESREEWDAALAIGEG